MSSCNGEGAGINSFALVSYLPEPLAGFLERLRKELVTECRSKPHVTILPPRPLECSTEEAWTAMRAGLADFQPFHIELGSIEVFPVTNVVYLSVTHGGGELRFLHDRLNAGCLAFEEPFAYHPHLTLAQDLDPADVAALTATAVARWRDFVHPRSFDVDQLTFVQNTFANRWTDLRSLRLAGAVRI